MWRVDLTSKQSDAIKNHIDHFLNHPPIKLGWQIPFVREKNALPLYIGWTETTGITPEGDVVMWYTEDEIRFIQEIDTQLFRSSLMEGVKRYFDLEFLTPKRPLDATTCEQCFGTGKLQQKGLENIICVCGGVGWLD